MTNWGGFLSSASLARQRRRNSLDSDDKRKAVSRVAFLTPSSVPGICPISLCLSEVYLFLPPQEAPQSQISEACIILPLTILILRLTFEKTIQNISV